MPSAFTLRLPPDPATGADEELLDVDVPPTDDLPPVPAIDVLTVQEIGSEDGPLWTAIDAAQLDQLWRDARLGGPPPTVDFDEQVVVAISVYGNGCVDRFAGLDVDAQRVWTPLFIHPGGDCDAVGVPRTYVVAADRSAAEPGFTLRRLDGVLYMPRGERRLSVEVPPT